MLHIDLDCVHLIVFEVLVPCFKMFLQFDDRVFDLRIVEECESCCCSEKGDRGLERYHLDGQVAVCTEEGIRFVLACSRESLSVIYISKMKNDFEVDRLYIVSQSARGSHW